MFDWDNEKTNAKDWAKTYKGTSVMYEGIATYKDESVYLSKDTLKRVMPELKGRPVIIEHKLGINPSNMENYAVGYVTKCEYNNETGDFDCDFVTWDEEAKALLNNGYTLSTSYKATEFNNGGTYINTPYDREITDLEFTHLAIVKNPRYEKVKVYQNSTEDVQEQEENKPEKQNDIFEEKEYHMEKIEVEQGFFAKLLELASKKFSVSEKQNSSDEDTFEYEGKTYSKKELVNSFEKANQAKLEEDEEVDAKDIIDEDEEEEEQEEKPEKEEKEEKKEKQNSSEPDWFELMQEKLNSVERGADDKIQPVATREKALEKGRQIYG